MGKKTDNGSYFKASLQFSFNGNIVVGLQPFCFTRMQNAELPNLTDIATFAH
jgi:hypothetical protein